MEFSVHPWKSSSIGNGTSFSCIPPIKKIVKEPGCIYKPSANGSAGGVDSCGRLDPGQDLPPCVMMTQISDLDHVHHDNYQDGVVVGMSRMGDGGKRSPASSTGSHLDSRDGEGK